MCALNVSRLRRFIASGEHDNEDTSAPGEIKSIARANIDPHFRHFARNGLPVTEVTCLGKTQSGGDTDLRAKVPECVESCLEFFSLPDSKHVDIVSIWIQVSSSFLV